MARIDQETLDRADMDRLARGSDAALNDLMERHAGSVHRFLLSMVRNEDDARDLAQETFVRLYRARARYQAGRKVSTWLYTIAANLGRNHLRWRTRHPTVPLDAPGTEPESGAAALADMTADTPADDMAHRERIAAVRRAVDRLPDEMREALLLCEWEELTMAEAANALQTTTKAVESRLYRARKLLREHLAKWLP